jgi:hypothetical protein
MSNFVGKKIYKSFVDKDNQDKNIIKDTSNFIKSNDKRITKNMKIQKVNRKDPLRSYSALIEFGDVTAFKTYNKLCALMSGKIDINQMEDAKKLGKKNAQDSSQTSNTIHINS